MTNKVNNVVDVRTVRQGENVYGLLANVGRIVSVYPWHKPGDPDYVSHHFVTLDEPGAVERACAVPRPEGVGVFRVQGDAELEAVYAKLPLSEGDAMEVDEGGSGQQQEDTTSSSSAAAAATAIAPPSGSSTTMTGSSSTELMPVSPLQPPTQDAFDGPDANGSANEPTTTTNNNSAFLAALADKSQQAQVAIKSQAPTPLPPSPKIQRKSPHPAVTVRLGTSPDVLTDSLPKSVLLTLHGENISLDLSTLEDNPRAVVALLQATKSERDKWIIVCAYYRRRSLPKAAMIIASCMIEFLNKSGVSDADLKPAHLLLAGCHSDLAKVTKGADGSETDASREHARKMKELLQKVYGTADASDNSNNGGGSRLRVTHSPRPLTAPPPKITPAPAPTAPAPPVGRQSANESPNKRLRSESAGEGSHTAILQREIQSLRDKNSHISRKLRKAEAEAAEAAEERARRRTLAVKLEETERALESARRVKRTVEEKLVRETELRRRLEGALEEERARARAAEEQLRVNQPGLPLLQNLATMLQQAGMGTPSS